MERFKKNEREEARASGIQGEYFDEIYRGLTDVNQRIEEVKNIWEEATEKGKVKEKTNMEKAMDMRKKARESLSEPFYKCITLLIASISFNHKSWYKSFHVGQEL